jgi:hypothetical protein
MLLHLGLGEEGQHAEVIAPRVVEVVTRSFGQHEHVSRGDRLGAVVGEQLAVARK